MSTTAAPTFALGRVAEVMHSPIVTCPPDTPLREVARLMSHHRIHAVVVAAREDARDWGIVSDLDLAAGAYADPDGTHAGDVQATPVVSISPDESLVRAAQLMSEYQVSRLIVVADDRPVGILSTLDIAAALAAD